MLGSYQLPQWSTLEMHKKSQHRTSRLEILGLLFLFHFHSVFDVSSCDNWFLFVLHIVPSLYIHEKLNQNHQACISWLVSVVWFMLHSHWVNWQRCASVSWLVTSNHIHARWQLSLCKVTFLPPSFSSLQLPPSLLHFWYSWFLQYTPVMPKMNSNTYLLSPSPYTVSHL